MVLSTRKKQLRCPCSKGEQLAESQNARLMSHPTQAFRGHATSGHRRVGYPSRGIIVEAYPRGHAGHSKSSWDSQTSWTKKSRSPGRSVRREVEVNLRKGQLYSVVVFGLESHSKRKLSRVWCRGCTT